MTASADDAETMPTSDRPQEVLAANLKLVGFAVPESLIGFSQAELKERAFQLTKTLVTIFGFFIASELPAGALAGLSTLSRDFATYVYIPLREFLDLISLANKSVRFLACSAMYPAFRETLKGKLIGCLPEALQPAKMPALVERQRPLALVESESVSTRVQ